MSTKTKPNCHILVHMHNESVVEHMVTRFIMYWGFCSFLLLNSLISEGMSMVQKVMVFGPSSFLQIEVQY